MLIEPKLKKFFSTFAAFSWPALQYSYQRGGSGAMILGERIPRKFLTIVNDLKRRFLEEIDFHNATLSPSENADLTSVFGMK
jgi:hypothetical protein